MRSPVGRTPAGDEGVAAFLTPKAATLDVPIDLVLFCGVCGEQQPFKADRELEFGLLGNCLKCGDERVLPFTRAISEVA